MTEIDVSYFPGLWWVGYCVLLIPSKQDWSSVPWKRPWLVVQVGWDWTDFLSFLWRMEQIIFKLPFSLSQYFSLTLRQKDSGNFTRGRNLVFFLPSEIAWIGRKFPFTAITIIKVVAFFSVDPAIGTVVDPF